MRACACALVSSTLYIRIFACIAGMYFIGKASLPAGLCLPSCERGLSVCMRCAPLPSVATQCDRRRIASCGAWAWRRRVVHA